MRFINSPITIRSINSDAVNLYPANTDYPNITDKTFYEEGVWTPTYTTNGTDFTLVTYDGVTKGRYVRIGNMVHLSGIIRTDAITVGGATGDVLIGGLPFTVKNAAGAYSAMPIS